MADTALDEDFIRENADIPPVVGGNVVQIPGAQPGQPQPATPSAFTPQLLELTFGTIFDFVAMGIGDGGEFWRLHELEKSNLAKAWHPVLQPLLDSWGVSGQAPLLAAVFVTVATVGPRLQRDAARRVALTDGTVTAKSGDSPSSPGQPEAENREKQIDLSALVAAA